MLWELNRSNSNSEYVRPIVTPLSTRHTSAIQALHYNSYSQTLYAGGADSKLTWYNLNSASSTTGGDVKFEHDRVSLTAYIKQDDNCTLTKGLFFFGI